MLGLKYSFLPLGNLTYLADPLIPLLLHDFLSKEKLDDFYERQDERSRKKRRKEAIQDTVITTLQTPIYTRLVEDAAKRRLELDKAMLAAREMMPSNIQKIMKSKQEQANLAADAEYRRALGVAAQQDAATRFAGLGMQRQFG